MNRFAALFSSLVVPALLFSSEFRSGQAASGVIGQSSFSISGAGITPTALSLVSGRLFVTDKGQRVLSFEVSRLLTASADGSALPNLACAVCLQNPASAETQSV